MKKFIVTFIILLFITAGCSINDTDPINNTEPLVENALPIPPLLEDQDNSSETSEFHLNAQQSTKEFIAGTETETFGYNGDYLGPVIRVRDGQKVKIHVENELGEETTVHWHGLEVHGEDGYLARSRYDAILNTFGYVRTFAQIRDAEIRHIMPDFSLIIHNKKN